MECVRSYAAHSAAPFQGANRPPFPPWAIVATFALNLMYQFWLHTEALPKLGAIEWLLNTPSHHRVHHAIDPQYLDRNFAGAFIAFDRLFGTFAAEQGQAPRRYGLVRQIETLNPLRIAFSESVALARDLRGAHHLQDALGYAFGPPGWSPDGSRETSAQIRARTAADLG